jgi:hypothetical protein
MRVHPFLFLTLVLCLAPAAHAAEFETLVMPGPVVAGHQEIESDCGSCHRPFDPGAESALCSDCHEDVASDAKSGTGFHGLAPGANGDCRGCHTDHEGRGADIVGLDPALFVHDWTDYPLRGAHRNLACATCHTADLEKHRDAPADCVGCHVDDDPHAGGLSEDCGSCHSEVRWGTTEFDHSKTDFALEGAHADAACSTCHANERWTETPSDCNACHSVDDVHLGGFGADCQSCHGVVDWKGVRFDHDRDTDFALTGRHGDAACISCHPGGPSAKPAPIDCLSCHRNDDVHRGSQGTDCGLCHNTNGWVKLQFDHDRDTDFALRGSHADASCESCHTSDPHQVEIASDCLSCHRQEDAHVGQLGTECQTCHGERTWRSELRFDHELTNFPLLGLHATVACESCHTSPRFQDAKTVCISCHREADTHERMLGPDCGSCHNPNAWNLWRFDHDKTTDFALHGAHEGVDCTSCHREAAFRPSTLELPQACVECHAAEDVHRGEFGARCETCHGDAGWDRLEMKPR